MTTETEKAVPGNSVQFTIPDTSAQPNGTFVAKVTGVFAGLRELVDFVEDETPAFIRELIVHVHRDAGYDVDGTWYTVDTSGLEGFSGKPFAVPQAMIEAPEADGALVNK